MATARLDTRIDTRITEFISKNLDELVMHRRWFHQHPETSYKEFETSRYIRGFLSAYGAKSIESIAVTGVICKIGTLGKTHAARFNMDGLPIPEENPFPYCSIRSGYSHSCGHDFELAWGLIVAKYFLQYPPNETIKLVFQPAEEGPGDESHGKTGGQLLAELGAFSVDTVMSLHVEPEIPLGTVSIIEGEVTCGAYDFEFVLHGKTCHAAKPAQGINPVPIAASLIQDLYFLQEKVKDESSMNEEAYLLLTTTCFSTQLQLTKGNQEESVNTIPEYGILKGISRVRSKIAEEKLLAGFQSLQAAYSTKLQECILNLRKVALATINDGNCVQNVKNAASVNGLNIVSKRTTWRDDAGWAAAQAPSAHGFIGIYDGIATALHSPSFNPNEAALPIGLVIFLGTLERHMFNFFEA